MNGEKYLQENFLVDDIFLDQMFQGFFFFFKENIVIGKWNKNMKIIHQPHFWSKEPTLYWIQI